MVCVCLAGGGLFWTNLELGILYLVLYYLNSRIMRAGKHRLIKVLFSLLFSLLLSINLVHLLMKNYLKKIYLCQSSLQQKYQSWDIETPIKKHKIWNKDIPCFCGLSLPWFRFFSEDRILEQWISESTALFSCVEGKVSLNFCIFLSKLPNTLQSLSKRCIIKWW